MVFFCGSTHNSNCSCKYSLKQQTIYDNVESAWTNSFKNFANHFPEIMECKSFSNETKLDLFSNFFTRKNYHISTSKKYQILNFKPRNFSLELLYASRFKFCADTLSLGMSCACVIKRDVMSHENVYLL